MTEYFHFSVGKLPSGNVYIARDSEEALMRAREFLRESGYTEITTQKIPLTHAVDALFACEQYVNKKLDDQGLVDRLSNTTAAAMPPRRMERKHIAS